MVSKPTNTSAGPHPANEKRICYSNRYPTKNKPVFFFLCRGWTVDIYVYLCGKPINHQECTNTCWPFWCVPPSHFWDQHVHASPFLDQRTDWKDMLIVFPPSLWSDSICICFTPKIHHCFPQKNTYCKTNKPYKRLLISLHVFLPIKRNQDSNHQMIRCVCFFYLRFIQRIKESLMW